MSKKGLSFLSDFTKDLGKMKGINTDSAPPRYWFSTGNYVQNYVMSGSFLRAIPQGRIVTFAGPSGSGKSFNIASACAAAQREKDAIILVVDSEGALDDEFMTKCGVNTNDEGYQYAGVNTFSQCQKIVSMFIDGYSKEYQDDPDAPPVVIAIDSLDMMMTDSEMANYDKGETKGDQGQRSKQMKAMLRGFNNDIKSLNITIITANQVYKNQDIMNGEGVWIVGDAARYSPSIIVLVTKLKLRSDSEIRGIRMKVEGYKTRFTKPFQTVTVEVDYDTGINATSGLADVAVKLGVLEKRGSRLAFVGDEKSFFEKNLEEHLDRLIPMLEEIVSTDKDVYLTYDMKDDEEEEDPKITSKQKRDQKAAGAE